MQRYPGYGRDYGARDHGPGRRGYDAEWRGYDAGWRGARYDHARPRRPAPPPGPGYWPYDATGWAPYTFTPFAFDPALGWAGWGPGTAYVPHPPPEPRRVPPRESPAYGRGGDREVRRWAERAGYDVEHTIRPRRGPRNPY